MAGSTEVALAAPAVGAPAASPAAPPEPSEPASSEPTEAGKPQSPNDPRALLAGFNRKATTLAAIRDALGLPNTTPDDDILPAVLELKTPRSVPVSDDPAIQAQWDQLEAQRLQLVEAYYGKDFATNLRTFRAIARENGDLFELANVYWASREAQGLTPPARTAAPVAPVSTEEEPPPEELAVGTEGPNQLGKKPIPADITAGLERTGKLKAAFHNLLSNSR